MPRLNVPMMTEPILNNYNEHVNNFILFLRDRLKMHLVYEGPNEIHQHILQKSTYACSVCYKPKKTLKDVFPVMIGSCLDIAIRHKKIKSFQETFDLSVFEAFSCPFSELDIGTGFFIIGGFLRQLPYLFANDPTNTHVIKRKNVRVYSYNAQDRGKELNFYVADTKKRKCGETVVVHNNGQETDDDPNFFEHCPYPVDLTAYMIQLYRDENFDIDHLGNKMVISPGHMFVKLFIKYLYGPLREQDWKLVKSKTTLIRNSIENGFLLHVLSQKTVYFKEGKSAGKMTNESQGSYREIGANGEVFIEKNIGCYREVPTQTYPLNPYLLYIIIRQVSNKVKNSKIKSFHPSYLHFLCMLGVYETKTIGRTTMMVRDTIVSTCTDLDPVYHDTTNETFWKMLNLEPQKNSHYYVVVNEACIPVSKKSFDNINLMDLKVHFKTIECYERGKFIVVRYKTGLILKKMPEFPIWVTPYDKEYWARRIYGSMENFDSFVYKTCYHVDINRYFNHTAFPKNILGFNAMKNAVLATNPKYAYYFMDTLSAYFKSPTPCHRVVVEPVDDNVSEHFALMMPQPMVTYMSFEGCTQEDCIVKRKGFSSFDNWRFHTIRLTIERDSLTWTKFYPTRGDQDSNSDLLGTLISGNVLKINPISTHVRCVKVSDMQYSIHFSKTPFRVVQHFIAKDKLLISVEKEQISNTGDKLCSLHGQKGVITVKEKMPILDFEIEPDLIINIYCLSRTTPGQIIEAKELGSGKDAVYVQNSKGELIPNAKAFYGRTFYFIVAYYPSEHLHAPTKCTFDRVTNQPVKGRSRNGGMKLGNMEINAFRGNGMAFCFQEKCLEHSDLVPLVPTVPIPKSMMVIIEEAKCTKYNLDIQCFPSITFIDK